MKMWQKLPVVVRAAVLGVVTFLVVQSAQLILLLNVELWPAVPWAVLLSLLFMRGCWLYLGGKGWPSGTRDARERCMRAARTGARRRRLAYVATIPMLAFLLGTAVVSSSVVAFPPESFAVPSFMGEMPGYMAVLVLVTFSLAAGVSEEVGFRGFMQVPLEHRYGPFLAISFTAVFFWLAHANGASFLHRSVMLLSSGYLMGYLAYYSRSLVPGVVMHTAADVIAFGAASRLFGLKPIYTPETIWTTGITPVFIFWAGATIVGGIASVLMLTRLARLEE